ncbi:LapA family protein [Desulfurivibrio dismutans]|uniref:LapA family protein n=1 Tax=Desulfurivibrio dismutans TaxID=1398908 RepID=UPI0023DC6C35|nr:LapA family protein [Desulfurivibrio alkaliphilus]MDF1614157.1 LapA family protein [Desulfurivibrio alkaliphilus]
MKTINRVKLKLLVALLLALLAIVVILQNVEPLTVQLLFVKVTMPRAALLAITLLVGVFIGILISLGITGGRGSRSNLLDLDRSQ